MLKRVAGTKDILPEEASYWQRVEHISRGILSLYNYKEIRTPIIEDVALFNRSLGESTEIVQKQMFLIHNKDECYALRPEGTAAIVRAYIENNLDKISGFMKLFYIGPMFRLERPQKGRLRQFHHVGCEVIGSPGPDIDIEVISLADTLLKAYAIDGYKIKINSLGCAQDKQRLIEILRQGLEGETGNLCGDCQVRFERNILRILDCKNETCQKIVSNLNINDSYLCVECKSHFDKVKAGLDSLGVRYEISPYLVRGLDYYTRTVFEIKHDALGAQDAIGAGGRYDTLVHELGGPDSPAIGFAFGVERLLLVVNQARIAALSKLVYVISLGEEAKTYSMELLHRLRKCGILSDTDYESKSLKGAMRKANDAGAGYVLLIGENELKNKAVTLKDMNSREQKEIKSENLIEELKKLLQAHETEKIRISG
jgi:histidyl-tRNA synthetase